MALADETGDENLIVCTDTEADQDTRPALDRFLAADGHGAIILGEWEPAAIRIAGTGSVDDTFGNIAADIDMLHTADHDTTAAILEGLRDNEPHLNPDPTDETSTERVDTDLDAGNHTQEAPDPHVETRDDLPHQRALDAASDPPHRDSPPMPYLCLFGSTEVYIGEKPVVFKKGKRAKTFLAALVLADGPISHADLLNAVLPGYDDPVKARNNLNTIGSDTRGHLQKATGTDSPIYRWDKSTDRYELDPDTFATDRDAFDSAEQAAALAADPDEAAAHLEKAVGLYTGDLAPDLHTPEVDQLREQYRAAAVRALRKTRRTPCRTRRCRPRRALPFSSRCPHPESGLTVSAAAVALSTGAAILSIMYALRLEPVTAGGRFAPDLTPRARTWVLAAGGTTAATAAVAAWTFLPPQPTSVPVVIAAALAPTLALADHRALILPPGIIGLLTITALGTFTIDATLQDTWDRTGPGMIGAAAIAAITALFWWPNRHRFGSGDVALIAACACFLGRHGWAAALWGTAIVTLTGALHAILYRLRHRVRGEIMPVGPAHHRMVARRNPPHSLITTPRRSGCLDKDERAAGIFEALYSDADHPDRRPDTSNVTPLSLPLGLLAVQPWASRASCRSRGRSGLEEPGYCIERSDGGKRCLGRLRGRFRNNTGKGHRNVLRRPAEPFPADPSLDEPKCRPGAGESCA